MHHIFQVYILARAQTPYKEALLLRQLHLILSA